MATTAEAQFNPPHADQVEEDEPDAPSEELDYDYDNIEILQQFMGEQNWWIFRPDPLNTGRRGMMNMAVTAATTMHQIEQRIVRVWPDLRPGRPDWNLQLAHYGAFDSFHPPLQDTTAAFIVKSDRDVNQGVAQRSIFLLSLRTWNLLSGQFVPTLLRAFVLDTQSVVKEFLSAMWAFIGLIPSFRWDGFTCFKHGMALSQ